MKKKRNTFGEGSPKDNREDKKMAKKRGMSMAAWEKSPADKKHDSGKRKFASGGPINQQPMASQPMAAQMQKPMGQPMSQPMQQQQPQQMRPMATYKKGGVVRGSGCATKGKGFSRSG